MALTSLTSLNSLTSIFAKVELLKKILGLNSLLFAGVQPFILTLRSLTPNPSPKERGVNSLFGKGGLAD